MEVGNLPLFLAKRVPQSSSVSESLGGQNENGSVEIENLVVPEVRLSENYRNQDEPTRFSATAQLSQTETGQAQKRGDAGYSQPARSGIPRPTGACYYFATAA